MTMDLQELWDSQAEWSQRTFGTDAERGPVGPLKHLEKEAREAINDPEDMSEYADCFLLILDAARRAGMTLENLLAESWCKHATNINRKWAKSTTDEPSMHVKD